MGDRGRYAGESLCDRYYRFSETSIAIDPRSIAGLYPKDKP